MPAATPLYQLIITLHVLSAIVWVGGVVFVAAVAVPIARRMDGEARRWLLGEVGRRFRAIGWAALGVLVATGSYMLMHWGATWANLLDGSFFASPHTRPLAYKLVLVALMLVVSGIHDWWLGPRATGAGSEDETMRRWAGWLGRTTGVLSIGIVVLAVFVARPWF